MGKFNSTTGYTSSKVPQAFVLLGIFFMIFLFFPGFLVESCLGLDEVFGTLQTGGGGRGYRLLGFVGKLVNLISNHTHTQAGSHVTATEVLRGCLSKFVSVRQLQEFLRAPFVGILRAYRLSQLVAVGLVSTSAIQNTPTYAVFVARLLRSYTMFYLLPTTRNNCHSQKRWQKASATAFATAGCSAMLFTTSIELFRRFLALWQQHVGSLKWPHLCHQE